MTKAHPRFLGALGLGSLAGALLAAVGCGNASPGTGGMGGSGGAFDCAAAVANASTTPVSVRFVNNTAGDLYVPFPSHTSCGAQAPFTITDPNGGPLEFTLDECNTTCEHAACSCVVTYTCAPNAPLTRIAAHGAAEAQWGGGVLEDRTVPVLCMTDSSCYGPEQRSAPCRAFIEPKAYPLTFSADASTGVDCSGDGCTCTPDASGSCPLTSFAATPAGTTLHGTGSFAKGGTSVDIVFQ